MNIGKFIFEYWIFVQKQKIFDIWILFIFTGGSTREYSRVLPNLHDTSLRLNNPTNILKDAQPITGLILLELVCMQRGPVFLSIFFKQITNMRERNQLQHCPDFFLSQQVYKATSPLCFHRAKDKLMAQCHANPIITLSPPPLQLPNSSSQKFSPSL